MARHEPDQPLRVAVLLGGESAEREVSLASGICVAAALEEAGHLARGIDPAEVDLLDVDWQAFDACFIALHGGAGEDGRVQQLLESLGVPYTGSGPAASRLAMSKSSAKERFVERGVPTPRFTLLDSRQSMHEMIECVASLCYPLVVKPDAQGSSLGVSIVRDADDLPRAVAKSQFYDRFVLAEQYIAGREFTVAVLERTALPLLEIRTAAKIPSPLGRGLGEGPKAAEFISCPLFTYEAKYLDPQTEYIFQTGLTDHQTHTMVQAAVAAADALGTSGLVRVDLRRDASGKPWVLEVNTIPGMTERSFAPRAAAETGLDMPSLCELLVRNAIASEAVR